MVGTFLGLSDHQIRIFGRPKTVSNILIQCSIASDEINSLCDFSNFVENLWNQTQNTKIVDLVRSDGTLSEDIRCGFGAPKGHTFSLEKP